MAESAQAVSADYQLIRSARRSVAIHIRQDGLVLVRAPLRMPTTFIDDFVQSRRDWIAKHLGDIASRKASAPESEESAVWWHLGDALPRAGRSEAQWLAWQRAEAAAYLPARLLALAAALGPAWQPRQIKLRRMRSRWGSCSHQRDITLPAGYKVAETTPLLRKLNKVKGTTYCAVTLLAALPSAGTAQQNFDAEWTLLGTQLTLGTPTSNPAGGPAGWQASRC